MAGNFNQSLAELVKAMDPVKHAVEISMLRNARSHADLARMSVDNGGWLNPSTAEPRLKLVRHGSGTFLVVAYKEGWSSRVSMADFPR